MRSKNMLEEKTTKKEIEKITKKEIEKTTKKEIEKIIEKEIEKIIEKIIEKEIEKIIENLEKVLDKLDNLASENPKKTIFSTWRVTARLHLARMKAYMGDKKAMSLVKKAEDIRDEQDAETGWKSYTLVLLLHTKGECYRAREEYKEAIKFLSLAARKILHEEYKNFEYLDNVLEGLLRIPKKRNKNLDMVRETIKKTREALYD